MKQSIFVPMCLGVMLIALSSCHIIGGSQGVVPVLGRSTEECDRLLGKPFAHDEDNRGYQSSDHYILACIVSGKVDMAVYSTSAPMPSLPSKVLLGYAQGNTWNELPSTNRNVRHWLRSDNTILVSDEANPDLDAVLVMRWESYETGVVEGCLGYFPEGVGDDLFSAHLAELGEPSLLTPPKAGEPTRYRLSWFSSFRGDVVIHVVADTSGGSVVIKRTDGGRSSGRSAGSIIENSHRPLSAAQSAAFLSALVTNRFEQLPSKGEFGGIIRDGETWFLESSSTSGYHVVERYCPAVAGVPDGPAVVTIGKAFIALTRLKSLSSHEDQVEALLKQGKVKRYNPAWRHNEEQAEPRN